jgi:malate dehydrogenase (oxaloacetate-decarboxylating)
MLIAGAKKLSDLSPAVKKVKRCIRSDKVIDPWYEFEGEKLLPDVEDAPRSNFEVGVAVALQAIKEGIAGAELTNVLDGKADEEIEQVVREKAREISWTPVYHEYVYDEGGLKDI